MVDSGVPCGAEDHAGARESRPRVDVAGNGWLREPLEGQEELDSLVVARDEVLEEPEVNEPFEVDEQVEEVGVPAQGVAVVIVEWAGLAGVVQTDAFKGQVH